MSRLDRLFGTRASPSAHAPTVNREGVYGAWERPLAEQYLQTLLTNTFGQTFYADTRDLLEEAARVHDQMLAEDPVFAGRALSFARRDGFMRSQPIYGLARLAAVDGPAFERAFGEVIRTPADLMDFASVMRRLRGGEGGRRVKRVAGRWLAEHLTEYWAIKYGGRRGEYSLADLFRVYHPRAGGQKRPLVDWVLGRDADLGTLPQIAALQRLKTASSDDEKVRAIADGRLPHEVVTPFAGSSAVWSALVPQLPLFALLRHLAALERHGVLDAHREHIERRFTDPTAVRGSKILPFRFLVAAGRLRTPWIVDALRSAVELSFANVPDLPGRTAVCLDRSGSMAGFMETAALFGICLMRKARLNGRLLAFDHALEEVQVSERDSLLSQALRIRARGGTDTGLPVKKLLADRDRVDNIVLVTDEQQNCGSPFVDLLARYRRKVNPAAKAFIVDVSPYRTALTPKADPLTWYVYGWSDQALRFVSMAAHGWSTSPAPPME